MAPPEEPCECFCLHCRRTFMSDQIWFQKVVGDKGGFDGFWMCPTPNCSGAGFTFDIFPTEPQHAANEGWQWSDDEEDEYAEDDPDADEDSDASDEAWEDEPATAESEYDPKEPGYADSSESGLFDGDGDDEDLEGEEWKYGLSPGERPKVDAPPPGVEPKNWAEQEALYDAPDRRPRELDWSNRPDQEPVRGEDDIPF